MSSTPALICRNPRDMTALRLMGLSSPDAFSESPGPLRFGAHPYAWARSAGRMPFAPGEGFRGLPSFRSWRIPTSHHPKRRMKPLAGLRHHNIAASQSREPRASKRGTKMKANLKALKNKLQGDVLPTGEHRSVVLTEQALRE